MLIKNNENLFVDVDSKKGYVIRLKEHEGATFTVTEDSNVVIGQAGRHEYTKEELKLLNVIMRNVDGKIRQFHMKIIQNILTNHVHVVEQIYLQDRTIL